MIAKCRDSYEAAKLRSREAKSKHKILAAGFSLPATCESNSNGKT
jgi:hypothetical protein